MSERRTRVELSNLCHRLDAAISDRLNPGIREDLLSEVTALEAEVAALTTAKEKADKALKNCLLLALRENHREMKDLMPRPGSWSSVIRFCSDAGIEPSILRHGATATKEPHA